MPPSMRATWNDVIKEETDAETVTEDQGPGQCTNSTENSTTISNNCGHHKTTRRRRHLSAPVGSQGSISHASSGGMSGAMWDQFGRMETCAEALDKDEALGENDNYDDDQQTTPQPDCNTISAGVDQEKVVDGMKRSRKECGRWKRMGGVMSNEGDDLSAFFEGLLLELHSPTLPTPTHSSARPPTTVCTSTQGPPKNLPPSTPPPPETSCLTPIPSPTTLSPMPRSKPHNRPPPLITAPLSPSYPSLKRTPVPTPFRPSTPPTSPLPPFPSSPTLSTPTTSSPRLRTTSHSSVNGGRRMSIVCKSTPPPTPPPVSPLPPPPSQ
ncbi:hypothetical protein HDV05_005195 [Chytridiales sp. JEL 0842]|nr:hypothetical protein HDV05_005195 [Chytridiales sp. JEL 0842]